MERDSTVVLIGDSKRFEEIYDGRCGKFTFFRLFDRRIRTALSIRAWDHVAPVLSNFGAFRRTKFIQLADGFVFSQNFEKPANRRGFRMYSQPFWDSVVFCQPLRSIRYLPDQAKTTIDFATAAKSLCQPNRIILVFGSDPFVGLGRELLFDSVMSTVDRARDAGYSGRIYYSAPRKSPVFRMMRDKGIPTVGPLSCFTADPDDLFVGTPSTALYKKYLEGMQCCVFDLFVDPYTAEIFSFFSDFDLSMIAGATIKTPEFISRCKLQDIVEYIEPHCGDRSLTLSCFRFDELLKQLYDICIQK